MALFLRGKWQFRVISITPLNQWKHQAIMK